MVQPVKLELTGEMIGIQPLYNSITILLTMVGYSCVWTPHHCEWSCNEVVEKGSGFSISQLTEAWQISEVSTWELGSSSRQNSGPPLPWRISCLTEKLAHFILPEASVLLYWIVYEVMRQLAWLPCPHQDA